MKDSREPVVFRVHNGTGQVIALFPEVETIQGVCLSMKQVGKPVVEQDVTRYRKMIEMSRPATQSELQPLLHEIRDMGLNPVIREKYRRKKV